MSSPPDLGTFGVEHLSTLSAVLHAAYSDPLTTSSWLAIMENIQRLVPYDFGGIAFTNVQTSRLDNRIYCDASTEFRQWHGDRYPALMVIANTASVRGLRVWQPADILGREEWEDSQICHELRDRFGVRGPVCITCGTPPQICARFWFIRSEDKDQFTERDIFLLGLLQAQFCNALKLARTLLKADVYREAWQQARTPRFVLDITGMIVDMNGWARKLTRDGEVKEYLEQIEAIARDMIAGNRQLQNADLTGERCRAWLHTLVLPSGDTTYVLTIDKAADVRSLMRECALDADCSEREADICMMLVRGASNREIADKLFIAESTVKDHVASIFDKLGVTHRSGVAPRLLGI